VAGTEVSEHRLVETSREGDTVEIEAVDDAVLVFGHADSIGAPVVSYGPFVMNTREEIDRAIRDYQAGKFGSVA
jgi:redox-sensitive bicupin YhaK (pirin superfamily)